MCTACFQLDMVEVTLNFVSSEIEALLAEEESEVNYESSLSYLQSPLNWGKIRVIL